MEKEKERLDVEEERHHTHRWKKVPGLAVLRACGVGYGVLCTFIQNTEQNQYKHSRSHLTTSIFKCKKQNKNDMQPSNFLCQKDSPGCVEQYGTMDLHFHA
jgi:hypothetical protein